MNKSKLLSIALVCALGLGMTSCVDDDESASVEAVRTAKAAQLNALAAYQNAQAAVQQAQADYQKLVNERYTAETEAAKAEYEQRIAEAQKLAEKAAQKMLENAQTHVATLFGNYTTANDDLADLNKELINQTALKAQLEAGVVSAEAAKKVVIAQQNDIIAVQTAKKAALEALDANDRAALQKEMETLTAKGIAIATEKATATNEKNVAKDAFDKAKAEIYGNAQANEEPTLATGIAAKALKDLDPNLVKFESQEVEKAGNTVSDQVEYYSLVQSQATLFANGLQNAINAAKNILGTPKTATVLATGLYLIIENANAALKTANDAYTAAVKGGDAVTIQQAASAVQVAQSNVEKANEDFAGQQEKIAEAEQKLADFNALVATFSGKDKDAYDKAIEEAVKLGEAYLDKAAALAAVEKEETLNASLKGAVQLLLNANGNIEELIAKCDEKIAQAQEKIAKVEYATGTDTAEALLAYCEETIADLKVEIEAQKAIVAAFKADLDAALA